MLNISSFFAKFKMIDGGRSLRLGEIVKSVNQYTKVNLNQEELVLETNGNLRINTSPLKRNEIFMHRDEIISDLNIKGVTISHLL